MGGREKTLASANGVNVMNHREIGEKKITDKKGKKGKEKKEKRGEGGMGMARAGEL